MIPHWKDTITGEVLPRLLRLPLSVAELVVMLEALPVATVGPAVVCAAVKLFSAPKAVAFPTALARK